jgi:hypothetical protein
MDNALAKALAAITEQLERLNTTLDGFKPPPSPAVLPQPHGRGNDLLSGRWHRRDGDGYGIFPRPGEHHADHPPGNIRPPHQR